MTRGIGRGASAPFLVLAALQHALGMREGSLFRLARARGAMVQSGEPYGPAHGGSGDAIERGIA